MQNISWKIVSKTSAEKMIEILYTVWKFIWKDCFDRIVFNKDES